MAEGWHVCRSRRPTTERSHGDAGLLPNRKDSLAPLWGNLRIVPAIPQRVRKRRGLWVPDRQVRSGVLQTGPRASLSMRHKSFSFVTVCKWLRIEIKIFELNKVFIYILLIFMYIYGSVPLIDFVKVLRFTIQNPMLKKTRWAK